MFTKGRERGSGWLTRGRVPCSLYEQGNSCWSMKRKKHREKQQGRERGQIKKRLPPGVPGLRLPEVLKPAKYLLPTIFYLSILFSESLTRTYLHVRRINCRHTKLLVVCEKLFWELFYYSSKILIRPIIVGTSYNYFSFYLQERFILNAHGWGV